MMRRIKIALVIAAFAASCGSSALAQNQMQNVPAMTAGQQVTVKAKIVAIDKANRVVTLKTDSGDTTDIQCGPEIKRFDDLKVGQTVTFVYREAVATQVAKYDPNAPTTTSSQTVTRDKGAMPGGSVTQVQTANVTITAIDPNAPSLTVKTPKGATMTFAVADKSSLDGLAVGDVVTVTYAQALMVSVQ